MSNQATLLYQKLKSDSTITTEAIIKSLIDQYIKSDERQKRINGENYYDSENTAIKDRKEKDLILNHRIPSGFLKKLVDQKINYCIGKDIVIENLPENIDILDPNEFIDDLALEASKKGIAWLYPLMNKKGEFDYKIIDSIECIPIWDTEFEDTLQTMIRFYQIEMVQNDRTYYRNKVEVYDNEKVTYYIEDIDHNYAIDYTIEINPIYYNSKKLITMGNITKIINFGWGEVPFIPLFNTKKAVYDLQNIKPDIDLYDVVKSDFANDLEFHQSAILVIINRGAQDLEEFRENLIKYKMITIDDVSEVGGAHYLTLEIPVEARKELLETIRKDIYEFGFGVDTKKLDGGSITNVYIESKFADLDLKADGFIKQIKKFLKKYYTFANIYLKETNKAQIDVKKLNYVFNKSMIMNMSEKIDDVVKSDGVVSRKTNLAYDPRVDDVEEEIANLEAEEVSRTEDNKFLEKGDDED
jgi:SPP1 family phage portal protein